MINKKGIAFEELVRIILAVLVLVVLISVFYILFKPTINNIIGVRDEGTKQGGSVIDDLFKAFGKKCEEGKIECNPLTNTKRVCENEVWVTKDNDPCDPTS